MSSTLKAIETVYHGYRFRSRLEARWSVFFDCLKVPWEFEKEGFELGGLRYLPDFWLPEQGCWVEIKGDKGEALKDARKFARLARGSGHSVTVFCGSEFEPWWSRMTESGEMESGGTPAYRYSHDASPDDDTDDGCWFPWLECVNCAREQMVESEHVLDVPGIGSVGTLVWKENPERPFVTIEGTAHQREHEQSTGHTWWLSESERLLAAYAAARSARFEFGEKGAR